METKNLGIIGLGRVGLPVAKVYLEAGYKVYGVDIDDRCKHQFVDSGGILLETPAAIADNASTVLILVLNDEQVRQVVCGERGVLQRSLQHDLALICMSTINRSTLEDMERACLERGIILVDCPFTGGPARVPSGNLTLIAAANPLNIDSVRPVLSCIGNITVVGEVPGMGQAVKHCNQLLVGATHAATMEVIALARRLDLNTETVCNIIGEGIAGSDYFRLLSQAVLRKTPSPGGLGQMCKDISIVKNSVETVGLPALVLKAAATYFKLAEDLGMQNREGADLIEVMEFESDR